MRRTDQGVLLSAAEAVDEALLNVLLRTKKRVSGILGLA